MARRTHDLTIDSGRDAGQTFRITEKSPWDAEWWAIRALLAMGEAGVEIPDNYQEAPLATFAQSGLKTLMKVSPDRLKPLFDEMFECVQWVSPDRKLVRALLATDIEDVKTLVLIREAVFKLHIGFFSDAEAPTSA